MALADSHVHLDRFPDSEEDGIVRRAREAGVELMLNAGVSIESSEQGIDLARRHPEVLAAAGVHPLWLEEAGQEGALKALRDWGESGAVVAVGEVGLDYSLGAPPVPAQQAFLSAVLDMACQLDLPVLLHVVEAHEDALQLLTGRSTRVVVHYFTGDLVLAERYLRLGCLLSVGKSVARPENAGLRAAVKRIPLDRLLLETDSYPLSGRTTEPRDVVDVCRAVAELRGETAEAVARTTNANLRRLLSLD